jgi:photosystem II stability/assembly factor-like uncharacterized protein
MQLTIRHLIGFLLFAISTFFQGKTLAQSWTETSGPSGGHVGKVVIHPQNPQIVYAIVSLPYSGVFKSIDEGHSWSALTNGFEFDTTENYDRWPTELAIDISNPETLYVAINDPIPSAPSLLYRSVNGGANWSVIKEDRIFALYSDKGDVFALSGTGLFFSSDAGNSWTLQNPSLLGDDDSNKILVDAQKVLWIGGSQGLFQSADSGKTFQGIAFPIEFWRIQTFDVTIINGTKLIVASVAAAPLYGNFYISYDEGKTWLDRTATLPFEPTLGRYSIPADVKISPSSIDHIYAGLIEGFFRTKNGGLNWVRQDSGLVLPHAYTTQTLPPIVSTLDVSPFRPDFLIAGTTNDGIFLSTDSGLSWKSVHSPSGEVEALSASKSSSGVFAASTGGVYYHDADSWKPTALLIGQASIGITELAVSPHNARIILCGATHGIPLAHMYRTFDGGVTWDFKRFTPTQILTEGDINKIVFDPIDTSRVYSAWTDFSGRNGAVMATDDQGDTWVPLEIPTGAEPVDMAVNQIDNRIVYLLRGDGQVDRSEDRGVTWTQIRAPTDSQHTVIRIDPRNQNTIYLGGFSLFKSEVADSSHWMRMPFDKKVTDLQIDPITRELFVGTYNEGVWRSSDAGNTFTKMPPLASERITSLLFYTKDQRKLLFAGTMGVGAYYVDLGPVSSVGKNEEIVQGYHLAQNYPNPFNSNTRITYQLAKPEKVALEIFNVLGQKIKILLNEERQAGTHSIAWDGSDELGKPVSAGLYLYTLSFRSSLLVRKMMYLK